MNGLINLNKAPGMSSHSAVSAVRRLLHLKTGHAGTLDPAAEGVLPLCLGKFTRLAEYLAACSKSYRGEIVLGIETDSYDAQGKILEVKNAAAIGEGDILALLPDFTGRILQKPPMVSALKFQGQPLYKLARKGQELELAPREVEIASLDYLGGDFGGEAPRFTLELSCSKGTYIRSLAHDIGQALGVGGHLASLQRLRVGAFLLEEAHTLEEIAAKAAENDWSFLFPVEKALGHMQFITAPEDLVKRLLHGNEVPWEGAAAPGENLLVKNEAGLLLGVGRILEEEDSQQQKLKLHKVLAGGE